MQSTLHIQTQVLEGNKIEIDDPHLIVGETVEVFVVLPVVKKQKVSDILATIENIRDHRSSFRTAEEINQFIREERDSWD